MAMDISNKQAFLIIGGSGSGKTTLARRWAERTKRKTVVINGFERDFPPQKFTHMTHEDADGHQFSNVNIIIEDLIMPAKSFVKFIRQLLAVVRRHNNCSVIVLAHSLKSNNLPAQMIKMFTSFVICHGVQNRSNAMDFFTLHTQLSEEESGEIWDEFLEGSPSFSYLVYDMESGRHAVVDKDGRKIREESEKGKSFQKEEMLARLRKQIYKFLPQESNRVFAIQLFEYIVTKIAIDSIKDLVITTKKGASAHILDVLYYATMNSAVPHKNIVDVYQEICKDASVPVCYTKNPHMLKK